MKLSYRSCQYEFQAISSPIIKNEITVKYRGITYQIDNLKSQSILRQTNIQLNYRGVSYTKKIAASKRVRLN
ncbi:MAG: DUF4278 domain-containing protein [Hydrococcus sp. RU_2_2]|jgi:Domain of unknown function (DUF4278)|nr:DUF4278 domain-containing protein [Hydrococcus sp. RU_2_2]NJP22234.1 DUF4278 domain-containing protein [Hydrococcus sp. CRU_1_1]